MKKKILVGAIVSLITACGSGSSGESRGNCADNTKVIRVFDETVPRDSYHFYRNTCNDLEFAGNFWSSELWGYRRDLKDTGYWWHNSEQYSLSRDSGRYSVSAYIPRNPTIDEKSQGAVVCGLSTYVDGTYDDSLITVDFYDINEYCYADNIESAIISNLDLDYSVLSNSQLELFQSLILNGSPAAELRDKAMASDNIMLCEVSSDEEMAATECAQ